METLIFYIFIFAVSCLALVRSGTLVVGSLTRIAQFLQWREFTVSFVLMAFATSAPELFVGVISALQSKPELSFGNIVGSNIINLTLVAAVSVYFAKGLKLDAAVARRSSIYTAVIALFPILLLLDGGISRSDAAVLFLVLASYFHVLSLEEQKFTKVFSEKFKVDWPQFGFFLKDLGMFLAGLLVLLASAQGIVFTASYFAAAAGAPLATVGILIVALGTNLPEIAFGVKAIAMGHKEMVLGNLMGSVVANSTLALGLTFLISPLKIADFSPYLVGIAFTAGAALLFAVFSATGRKITQKEGLVLFALYLFFVAAELFLR